MMNGYNSPFLNLSPEKWGLANILFLILLLAISIFIYHHIIFRKYVKDALINKDILLKLHNHLQSTTFRGKVNDAFVTTYISENILTLIGFPAKSVAYNKDVSYRSLIYPDDRAGILNAIRACNPSQANYQAEYRVQTKWGAEKWILEQGIVLFDKKGNPRWLEGILTDITYYKFSEEFLRESEKRFQVLIEHAPIGICIFYNDMITFVNQVFLNMFDIGGPQEILGSSILDCLVPAERESVKRLISMHHAGKSLKTGHETIGLRKDGSEFPVEIFLTQVSLGDFLATLAYFTDITEHKQSEEKLLSLNQRLNDIIELFPDPTFVVDKHKQVIYWNKATEELTGLPKEEILGKGDYAYALPFYGKRRPMMVDLVDSHNPEIEGKYNYIKRVKDKLYGEFSGQLATRPETTYLWVVAAPLHDSNGNRFGTIEVIKDITEPKKREIALAESEEKARVVIDINPDIIVLVKKDSTILDCNESLSRILGKSHNELIGKNLETLLPKKDRLYRQSMLNQVLESGNPYVFEYKSDDGTRYFTVTIYPVKDTRNEIVRIVIYAKNNTNLRKAERALQEAEERYRSVFDQSGLASNVYDLSGKLIMQNSLASSMLDENMGEVIGKTVEEFLPTEAARVTRQIINKTLREGNITEENEINLPTGKYWFKTTSHLVHGDSGDVIGVQLISQDITESKELDRKILNTIIETEEKERINFAQELHDGLGPILSAIKMYVQWLSKPDAKIPPEEIRMDTERLINDAQEAIREISFKLSPHILTNFGLIEALKTFAEKIQLTSSIGINISGNFNERLEETTETILYRILCECINNTLKHASASGITIRLLKINKKLKINYYDDGTGFPVQTILEQKKGSGLFNIRSRLQSVNGFLFIKSSPGQGTRIIMTVRF